MVNIISSDVYLLYGSAGTEFDDTRMEKEFECGESSSRQRQYKVVGMTEVGVGKFSRKRTRDSPHMEVMLKAKVVLEQDFIDSRTDTEGGR